MNEIKRQFDDSQAYQTQAVQAVIQVFDGQPLASGAFEMPLGNTVNSSLAFSVKGIANQLLLGDVQLLANVQAVQQLNDIELSSALIPGLSASQSEVFSRLNFSIEMETGTGKTYTFIRTIYELNKTYGFKKFVIVVPSVAIREGALENLKSTHSHFQALYEKPPVNFVLYDSRNLTALRNFAMSNAIQILVINIDSFTKDNNVINSPRENGIVPIEYIQATSPIVIVDEPQNFETDIRKKAIADLNPLCTLRYSATHKNPYNLLYSLNPVQAYDLGLVKQIEVDGITADANYNAAYIKFEAVKKGKTSSSTAIVLSINANTAQGVKPKTITIKEGNADLYELSNQNPHYQDLMVTEMGAEFGEDRIFIELSNGQRLYEAQEQGGLTDDIMRYQIERTVQAHFAKLKALKPQGIKVLSLFFIDRVANYRCYDESSSQLKGKFALWFEEAYQKIAQKPAYQGLIEADISAVHDGYFASDKSGKGKDKKEVWVDSKEANTQKDNDAYALIMQKKDRLLSLDEPLQFIFSHSALREGWDNPNVFQICTLNESKSAMKKRQEIGRGLRLPVNQQGKRIFDKKTNVLTVVANESYESFAKSLQSEIEDETGVKFINRIKNARAKALVKTRDDLNAVELALFNAIWSHINYQASYAVAYSSEDFINNTVKLLQDFNQYPKAKRPVLSANKVKLDINQHGVDAVPTMGGSGVKQAENTVYAVPDIYVYVENKVKVTRSSIFAIIKQSKRLDELIINPQHFLDALVSAMQQALKSLLVDGIQYQRLETKLYEQSLLDEAAIEAYLTSIFPAADDKVAPLERTLYQATAINEKGKAEGEPFNCVLFDSDVERKFAEDCNTAESEKIKFYFKLPSKFKIPTPAGNYNPDWAVVVGNENCVYFVAETKSALNAEAKRGLEKLKLDYATKYFALKAFVDEGVVYKEVTKVSEL